MDENEVHKPGPELATEVGEVQGRFATDAALQDAVGRLTLLGFDRADLSLPDPNAPQATPDHAEAAVDEIDKTQMRTMASGMAGASAGSLVAGVMVASGGIAAPLVAAAAGVAALGTAAATTGAGVMADQANASARDRLGAEGKLILAVRARDADKARAAAAAMREAGAQNVVEVTRVEDAMTRGVSASSWTG